MPLTTLKKRSDFVAIAKNGEKIATKGVVLQGLASTHNSPRIGYTATRKLGNAVVRNRVKRRLRAVADCVFSKHEFPPHDYVLVGRWHTKDRPFEALVKDLTYALHKVDEASQRHD